MNEERAQVESGGLGLKSSMLGMHHIRTPLSKLHSLYNSCLENHSTNSNLIDIARYKLFKPIGIKKAETDKLSFANQRCGQPEYI
jgi:hypothetical protein